MALRQLCDEICTLVRQNQVDLVDVELTCGASEAGDDGLTNEDLAKLASALRSNRYVTSLVLWGNKELSNVEPLLTALEQNNSVTRVNLELTGVSSEDRQRVTRRLIQKKIAMLRSSSDPDVLSATSIDMSRMGIVDSDMHDLVSALRSNICLSSLSLWGNDLLSDAGAAHIVQLLQEGKCPLISISLDNTGISNQMHNKIRSMLSGIDDESLESVSRALRTNRTTTSLYLSNNPGITSKGITSLLATLGGNTQRQPLVHILVDTQNLDEGCVSRLKLWRLGTAQLHLKHNTPNITSLDLSRCGIADNDLLVVVTGLASNTHLSSLNVSRNKGITDDSLNPLLLAIEGSSLARVNVSGTSMKTTSVHRISHVLKKRNVTRAQAAIAADDAKTTRVDVLKGVDLSDRDVAALAGSIKESSGLVELDLSGNKALTDKSVDTLLAAMRSGNTSLRRLLLADTSVSDAAKRDLRKHMLARALAAATAALKNGGLAGPVVDVSGYGLKDAHVVKLAEQAKRSSCVTELNVSGNAEVTDVGGEALLAAVREERCSLVRVVAKGTSIGGPLKARLADACRDKALKHAIAALSRRWHPPLLMRGKWPAVTLCEHGLQDADVVALAEAMRHSELVAHVDISNNPHVSQRSGHVLLDAAKSNTNLHTLVLDGTGVSTAAVVEIQSVCDGHALACALAALRASEAGADSITCLRGRGLTDVNVKDLAKAITMNTTVQELDLSCNPDLTDASVRALEASLLAEECVSPLTRVCLDGTRVSPHAKVALDELLQGHLAKRLGKDDDRKKKGFEASEEELKALVTMGAVKSRWQEMQEDLRTISQITGQIAAALTLELRNISSKNDKPPAETHFLLQAPPETAQPKHTVLLASAKLDVAHTDGLENASSAVGVRLKMDRCPVSFRGDLFKSDVCRLLGLRPAFVEVLQRTDVTIQDLNIAADPTDPQGRSSSQAAAQLYSLAEDRGSELCLRYNQGREIFCHYPWPTSRTRESERMLLQSADEASPLQQTVARALNASSSSVAVSFGTLVRDLMEFLQRMGIEDAHVEGLCADAMNRLEPLVSGLASRPPFSIDDNAFRSARAHTRSLCDEYVTHVSERKTWTKDTDSLETQACERLLQHWGKVKKYRSQIQDWVDFLLRFDSHQPTERMSVSIAETSALEVATVLKESCRKGKNSAEVALAKLQARNQVMHVQIREAMEQLAERRKELDEEMRQVQASREQLMTEIRAKLLQYEALSMRLLGIAAKDQHLQQTQDAMAKAGQEQMMQLKHSILQTESSISRLQGGVAASEALKDKVKATVKELRGALSSSGVDASGADKALTADVFIEIFCYLYTLVHLVISRYTLSMQTDKREASELREKASDMEHLGKVAKVQSALAVWQAGVQAAPGLEVMLADRSLGDQLRRQQNLMDLGTTLGAECDPVWLCMSKMKLATLICAGSAFEVIVLLVKGVKGVGSTGDRYEVLPHPRALAVNVTYTDMTEDQEECRGMALYLKFIIHSKILRTCAASKQFFVEYKQIAQESKRAEDTLMRLRARSAGVSANADQAQREASVKSAEAGAARMRLAVSDVELEGEEDKAKKAEEAAQAAKDALESRREEFSHAEEAVLEAQAALEKARQALVAAEGKLDEAVKESQKKDKDLVKTVELLEKARQAHSRVQISCDVAESAEYRSKTDASNRAAEARNVKASLKSAEEHAERMRCVVGAYRYVAEAGPQLDIGGAGEGFLIDMTAITMLVCIKIVLDEAFEQVCPPGDIRRSTAFRRSFKNGFLFLLSGKASISEMDARTNVSTIEKHVSGATSVVLYLTDEQNQPVSQLVDFLRTQLFPYSPKVAPALLPTGEGRLSKVLSLAVHDPIGRGHIGDVRVGRLGRHTVVTKTFKMDAGTSQTQIDRIRRAVLAQFTALGTLSHPNVLSFRGVVLDASPDCPALALVQDYCYSSLSDFLSRYNSSHDPTVWLSEEDIHKIFRALDGQALGYVSQERFFKGVLSQPWIAEKMGMAKSVGGKIPLESWLYKFHVIARDGSNNITQESMARYYGARELPNTEVAWAQRFQVAVSITKGLEYLASHGLVHGNLKSCNVAIVHDDSGSASGTWLVSRIALMDYGLPHLTKTGDFPIKPTSSSSIPWQAPELFLGGLPSAESDLWSMGVVMWEILTGEVPWAGKTHDEVRELVTVVKQHLEINDKSRSAAPPGYIDAMQSCWKFEPPQRPTVTQVLDHMQSRRAEWPEDFLPG